MQLSSALEKGKQIYHFTILKYDDRTKKPIKFQFQIHSFKAALAVYFLSKTYVHEKETIQTCFLESV